MIGIPVLDHVALAGDQTFSFPRDGALPKNAQLSTKIMHYTDSQQQAIDTLDGNLQIIAALRDLSRL